MGKNSIGEIAKRMSKDAELEGRKTNHSARKTTIQTLKDNNVQDTDVMKITGHKNAMSLKSYYEPSIKKQKQLSSMLSKKLTQQSQITSEAIGKGTTFEQYNHVSSVTEISPPAAGPSSSSMDAFFRNCTFNGNVSITMAAPAPNFSAMNNMPSVTYSSDEE